MLSGDCDSGCRGRERKLTSQEGICPPRKIEGDSAGDSPRGPSSPFWDLRVLSMRSTVAVRATQAAGVLAKPCPWAAPLTGPRFLGVLLDPLCHARVCARTHTHPLLQSGPFAVPRLTGGLFLGLQVSLLGHLLLLPRGTHTRLCHLLDSHPSDSVSSARSMTVQLIIHIRADVGCEINYEREFSSLFGQNRSVSGTVLGKWDPTWEPFVRPPKPSPGHGASPRLATPHTPS